MEIESYRMFNCSRCGHLVGICTKCDRGNRYCGPVCAQEARVESRRRANRRYQATARGRRLHRERQARYRAHRRKVTDQGCKPVAKPEKSEETRRKIYYCSTCGAGPVKWHRHLYLHQMRRPSHKRRSQHKTEGGPLLKQRL